MVPEIANELEPFLDIFDARNSQFMAIYGPRKCTTASGIVPATRMTFCLEEKSFVTRIKSVTRETKL